VLKQVFEAGPCDEKHCTVKMPMRLRLSTTGLCREPRACSLCQQTCVSSAQRRGECVIEGLWPGSDSSWSLEVHLCIHDGSIGVIHMVSVSLAAIYRPFSKRSMFTSGTFMLHEPDASLPCPQFTWNGAVTRVGHPRKRIVSSDTTLGPCGHAASR
jgi:hypothetical protein